jgi:amylosucrase/maltose alpha-D-glucosyltransferase/alpha-amylase
MHPVPPQWLEEESARSLQRVLPRLADRFRDRAEPAAWEAYVARLERHFPRLFGRLHALYGHRYDFFWYLEGVLASATTTWLERSEELRALDGLRAQDPHWYLSSRMVGASCYVDLFAGDLEGLHERIPYLAELGVTALHLMPLLDVSSGDNDGGYAVRSYREVAEHLGTMEDLRRLATDLRDRGISLVLDFVFNHTSDEHEWARRAMAGERRYRDYYRIFPDRTEPDAYEAGLPEVFAEDHPGAFTYHPRMKEWVWTTFHTYQWDLNYENPEVFQRMVEEMLFLANQGVEIMRLDAVAFLWKRKGTNCQNLPEAHLLIQAFNAVARIAAPALVLKSEAIVHPDEVRKYIGEDECPLSYNPQLMALLWDALATRDVRMVRRAMERGFGLPRGCGWVNYVRCHDDIGWAFGDEDVAASGFDPEAHRRFLTRFYTGRFEGSFARGEPFQEEPVTGHGRVSGTLASLCGVEAAREAGDPDAMELAIRRVLLLQGLVITLTGIPLIYLGDEIGMLNDYGYEGDPRKIGDSRWLHRAPFDWERARKRDEGETVPGRIFHGILRLIRLRTQNPAFERSESEILDTGNDHVLGVLRAQAEHVVFILANFSEREQRVEARRLRQKGLRKSVFDLASGRTLTAARELALDPYQLLVLSPGRGG